MRGFLIWAGLGNVAYAFSLHALILELYIKIYIFIYIIYIKARCGNTNSNARIPVMYFLSHVIIYTVHTFIRHSQFSTMLQVHSKASEWDKVNVHKHVHKYTQMKSFQ